MRMPATPYNPVSWNGEAISREKLSQMANNDQWFFENMTRARYSVAGLTRDTGLRMIMGKTPFPPGVNQARDWVDVKIEFGSYFTVGCKPIIVALVETTGTWLRKYPSLRGLNGEIDHTGFIAHVVSHESFADYINAAGWVHWQAWGY